MLQLCRIGEVELPYLVGEASEFIKNNDQEIEKLQQEMEDYPRLEFLENSTVQLREKLNKKRESYRSIVSQTPTRSEKD